MLNERIELILSKLFLGGSAPSSSFFRLVQAITQPLIALGIHIYELAEQNATRIITGTELKRVYGSKIVKEKPVALNRPTALANEEYDPAEAGNIAKRLLSHKNKKPAYV